MSLFKKIKKAIKSPVKAVTSVASKAIQDPIRATMAVSSLGLSEAVRQAPVVGEKFKEAQKISSAGYKIAADVYTGGLYSAATQTGQSFLTKPREGDMALNIGGLLGGISTILGGNQNPYFQGTSQILGAVSTSLAQPTQNWPMPMQQRPMIQPTMVSSGAVAVRSQALTREVFDAGLQLLSKLGLPAPASMPGFSKALKAALSSIAALARRTPSGTMVSLLAGLGLAVYESNLLTVWFAQKKRGRRMNPANSKALRRAARRIKSFHKLCVHTDLIKTRSRSRGFSKCGTCRKSPCRC